MEKQSIVLHYENTDDDHEHWILTPTNDSTNHEAFQLTHEEEVGKLISSHMSMSDMIMYLNYWLTTSSFDSTDH